MPPEFSAILEFDRDGFVTWAPELDVISGGDPVEEARHNLHEAVELFLESASATEIADRLQSRT
jgi:predicted RNase H-like HicB family nuclease